MLNTNNERELAYVVRVNGIEELPGYDRVESALVGGWRCIVPKGQFKPGSLGIYFEIDARVPSDNPAFAFMEKRNYKVKTQKMCKSISQGLLMAPADFGWVGCEEPLGTYFITDGKGHNYFLDDESRFLTKTLGVTYADPEDNSRKAASVDKYKKMTQRHPNIFKKSWARWLMKRNWGRKVMYFFFGKKKDKKNTWPAWVVKTDEERVQNMPWILKDKSEWIATEKIDGTSTTFTMKRKGKKFDFYVCSRNVVFDTPDKACFYDSNVYLEMSEKYNVKNVLKTILMNDKSLDWVTLQGETYGAGIQNRDYSIEGHDFAGFNLIDSKNGRWNSIDARKFIEQYSIPWVPIIDTKFILPDTVEELLNIATGSSILDGKEREGIVFRSCDGVKSFKAVSNSYLLSYHS